MRASYYMETVKKPENDNEALATALSVIRSVSVPVGITTPGQPNIASTQWRTMADQRNELYFFESAFSPYLFWVDLNKTDFSAGSGARKLNLTDQSVLVVDGKFVSGEVSDYFKLAAPFMFGHGACTGHGGAAPPTEWRRHLSLRRRSISTCDLPADARILELGTSRLRAPMGQAVRPVPLGDRPVQSRPQFGFTPQK